MHKFDPRSYVLCFFLLEQKVQFRLQLLIPFALTENLSLFFVIDFMHNLLIPSCTSGSSG